MTKADIVRENLRLAFRLAETDADELAAGEPVLLVVNPHKPHKPAIIDARELLTELRRLLDTTQGVGEGS